MSRIGPQETCWDCLHEYALHRRYESGTDCTRCPCSGFVRADHPWRLRVLLWIDRWSVRRR